jgi:hypothetical protein
MEDEDSPGPPGEWVTIAEAARRIGITPKAVRERVRHGTLAWKPHGNVGRLVLVTEPPREPSASPGEPPRPHGESGDEGAAELVADLREALAEERVARARAEGRLEAELRRADELRAERDRLEADLREARKPWVVRVVETIRRR